MVAVFLILWAASLMRVALALAEIFLVRGDFDLVVVLRTVEDLRAGDLAAVFFTDARLVPPRFNVVEERGINLIIQ